MKILLVSLYHPELVRGGAQTIAYELFQGLQAREGVEVTLLASVDQTTPALYKSGARITGFDGRPDEYLYLSQEYDYAWEKTSNVLLVESFKEFLLLIRPDVVHFHHFMTFGIDFLTLTRRVLPHAKIVFTAHEFLTICAANGHMQRRTDGSLCTRASAVRCHQCLPERPPEHYFMREMWMKSHLAAVDHFTVPSRFMIGQFASWGLDAAKFSHIPNGLRLRSARPEPAARPQRNRFGFFGQLVDAKGIHVILEAVALLRAGGFDDFVVELNGDNIRFASPERRAEIETFLAEEAALPSQERRVFFNGSYHPDQLASRMARIDWCIVPSVWWEIFCLVITEAWNFGRPVIASNAGGPAERITDGVDGLLFELGDARALAETMRRAATEPGLWARLASGIVAPGGGTRWRRPICRSTASPRRRGSRRNSRPAPRMSDAYVEDRRRDYFAALRAARQVPAEAVRLLYQALGPVYQDQIDLLLTALNEAAAASGGPPWSESELFTPQAGLTERACALLGAPYDALYFSPTAEGVLTWLLYPEHPNEHRAIHLPFPLCQRLPFPMRPDFKLHHLAATALFVSPGGFCAFDRASRVYWPIASSRCLPARMAELPAQALSGPVVLIQDRSAGGNFAHFLFDHVFRIALFCRHAGDAAQARFIMGGACTPFHREILQSLCEIMGLSEANFIWPESEMQLELGNGVFVFSDTALNSVHPAYMAHPAAIGLIRRIAHGLRIEAGTAGRLYISRADAQLRRLANEDALIAELSTRSYRPVQLGRMKIRDQFAAIAGARAIIAPHGMGLAHIALHECPLDLLELFNPRIGSDAYAFISRAKGFGYAHLVGRDLADQRAGYEIDIPAVEQFARCMA